MGFRAAAHATTSGGSAGSGDEFQIVHFPSFLQHLVIFVTPETAGSPGGVGEPWGTLTELWEALGELWEGPWQIPQKHLKVKEQKSHHWALEQRLEFNSGAPLHGILLRFFSKTPSGIMTGLT